MDRSYAARAMELGYDIAVVVVVVGFCQLVTSCTTCEVRINAEEISKTEIETDLSEGTKSSPEE